ncbi:CsbD family protein [Devosia sp. 1566]|uniref:CsbD family protein n=1 Tax=Devosia sp. 1566 TaxID=2499144 RepID=UPI000FDB958F|nr:CsbD family protein [Devosia sp. 1566]
MHKDEAKGAGNQAKGAIKDAVGGLTGDERLQAEGKADKTQGKVQQKVGEVKEAARDMLKK